MTDDGKSEHLDSRQANLKAVCLQLEYILIEVDDLGELVLANLVRIALKEASRLCDAEGHPH